MAKGEFTKARKWMTKYGTAYMGIPGGTQLNRMVDGVIDVSQGKHTNAIGNEMFPVTEKKDQLRAILFGPYSTAGGKDYIRKRYPTVKQRIFDSTDDTPTGRRKTRTRTPRTTVRRRK